MAKEIRFTITDRLNEVLTSICDNLGIDKVDYMRSLIISDLREKGDEVDLSDVEKVVEVKTQVRGSSGSRGSSVKTPVRTPTRRMPQIRGNPRTRKIVRQRDVKNAGIGGAT
jgi:hypothetical protein